MLQKDWTAGVMSVAVGFNAEPAGAYSKIYSTDARFIGLGTTAVFLTSSTYPQATGSVASYYIYDQGGFMMGSYGTYITGKTDRGSVRFVKDN